jgi:hypothetical protein
MATRSERVKVKGVQKEMSRDDIEMYALCLWLSSKRIVAERRRREAKAKERRREIERRREGRA